MNSSGPGWKILIDQFGKVCPHCRKKKAKGEQYVWILPYKSDPLRCGNGGYHIKCWEEMGMKLPSWR